MWCVFMRFNIKYKCENFTGVLQPKLKTKNWYLNSEDDQTASLVKNRKQIILFIFTHALKGGRETVMSLGFYVVWLWISKCLILLVYLCYCLNELITLLCFLVFTVLSVPVCFLFYVEGSLSSRVSLHLMFPPCVSLLCEHRHVFHLCYLPSKMSIWVHVLLLSESDFCLLFASLCSGLTIAGFWFFFPPLSSLMTCLQLWSDPHLHLYHWAC